MLLAFIDSDGTIYPFTSLRKVSYKKGYLSIRLYCIGAPGEVLIRYSSTEDAIKAYNGYIQYLTVPDLPSSPI